jgi:hypothetical protein
MPRLEIVKPPPWYSSGRSRLSFARPASSDELTLARQVLATSANDGTAAAWCDLAHVLLCSNEFVYLD